MFEINRKTDYAVRVLLALAKHTDNSRLPTQQILEEMLIPKAFAQRIVADLSRVGLVNTSPGPRGGLKLGRKPEDITLREVVEAIDGKILVSDCLRAPGECPLDETCPVRKRWARLQSVILKELEATTLAILAEEAFAMEAAA